MAGQFSRSLVAACLVAQAALLPAMAGDNVASGGTPVSVRPFAGDYGGPYCGVYSLYGAARALGMDVSFQGLLKPEYIGSTAGSSVGELQKAATDLGLSVLVAKNLDGVALRSASSPMILHVRAKDNPGQYNHWILFLGMQNGLASIVDADGPEQATVASLLARWDGVALCLSRHDVAVSPWEGRMRSLAWILLTGTLMVAACHVLNRLLSRKAGSAHIEIVQAGAVIALSGVVAAGYHSMEDGFFKNPETVRYVQARHAVNFLEHVDFAELFKEDTVLIDARYPRDYAKGHIPGAISFPIDSSDAARRTILSTLAHDARIIVYCQSVACTFDEDIARILLRAGYRNVRLYPGGWREWDKQRKLHSASAESR